MKKNETWNEKGEKQEIRKPQPTTKEKRKR